MSLNSSSALDPSPLKTVLKIAVPSALAMLAGYAMQIVDTIFVGQLGPQALGGAALGNAVTSIFFVIGIGILSSLDFLIAHAHGAREHAEERHYLANGIWLGLLVGVASVAAMYALSVDLGFYARFDVAPELAEQAVRFLRPMSWTLLPFFVFQVLRVFLQSRSIVMPAMVILVLANIINAIGNWIFVLGRPFGPIQVESMGVAGSGYATGISRVFMVFALAGYLIFYRRELHLDVPLAAWRDHFRPQLARFKRMAQLGGPASLQTLFEVGVFSTATLFAGKLGENALAAHQVSLQIASSTFMLPLGISFAAASLVGQKMGAGRYAEARHLGWLCLGLCSAVMMGCALLVFVLGRVIASAFTQHPEVLAIAVPLLTIVALFQLFDGAQAVATGALRGAGNTLASAGANLVGHWFIGLPLGLTLAFTVGWGVYGIWIGLSTGLIVVAVFLTWFWRRWMSRFQPTTTS